MASTPSRLYPDRPEAVPGRVPEPTITELMSDLREETTELFRKEVELARLEISNAVSRFATGVSAFAVGGAVAFAGLLFLLAAAAFGLDQVLHMPWLSTLIVGAAAVVIGAICFAVAKAKLVHLTPERSLHSLKQDGQLVGEHLPGGGS
jgi:Putative Actinobacterial Holin-X, holin superfamily III